MKPLSSDPERGSTTAEYLGVVTLVAAIITALLVGAPPIGESIGSGIKAAICRMAGTRCDASGSKLSWADRKDLVDHYTAAGLDEFLAYRSSPQRRSELDWTTDGCSAPVVGSSGVSFDFTDACLRHDFGYRNYKKLGLFGQNKKRVDRRFMEDMKEHCATRGILVRDRCYRWAYRFYYAVVAFA